MSGRPAFLGWAWLCLGLAVACSGCAALKGLSLPGQVTGPRLQRQAAAERAVAAGQAQVRLAAALERWQAGDEAGCEQALAALVEERPQFVAARLRLGELLLARDDAAGAEQQFRAALEGEPASAEGNHALALALHALGRGKESRGAAARAVELEPDNTVYRATLASLDAPRP